MVASDSEVPAQLLTSVYEAACDPSRWSEVLAQIALWVSGELGARPHGLRELQGVILLHSTHWAVAVTHFGRAGRELYRHTRARLEAITPHVNRALTIGHRFDGLRSSDPALLIAQQMELVHVLQVDGDLRVLHGREPLRDNAFQAECAALTITKRRLRAASDHDHTQLVHAVNQALRGHSTNLTLGTAEARMSVGVAPGPWLSPLGHERSASIVFAPPRTPLPGLGANRFADLPKALRGVAEGLAEGLTDKEIAHSLGLPLTTARTYVARVLKRIGVNSRRELMRRA